MTISARLPHDSAEAHVTGFARYTDDVPTPKNCLHLAFGTSRIARGRLEGLEVEQVRKAPGVQTVLTKDDFQHIPDCAPAAHDEPLLATRAISYTGQPLFLVIAETHLRARAAAHLGTANIIEERPILTVEDALAAETWFDSGPRTYTRGTPQHIIQNAPHRLEGRLELGGQEHFYLEGQTALALPQDNGDMRIICSSQHPSEIQHKVAHALGVPMHAVQVEVRRMGGAFGGKESQGNALAIACAIAAQRTGRPCKMRYDRDDDFMITGKRHDIRIDYEVGFTPDGKIEALLFKHYLRCGWSQDLSLPVADRAMLHADNAYFIPHMEITSYRLRTNIQSATAFRGFGGPQGMAGIERVMDHIAHHLGKDPLEVRQANFYKKGQTTHYGQKIDEFALEELVPTLAATADYTDRRAAIAAWNAEQKILKRGIALTPVKFGISFTLTHLNQAGALVHVYQDGSVMLNHGGTEMGQGLFQKVAQVAAHRFGLPLERVKITATDTAKVPNTSATAASSGSDLNGMAVAIACDKIKAAIAAWIAPLHQAVPEDVTFKETRVIVGATSYSWEDAIAQAYQARVPLSATGFYKTPSIAWDRNKGQGRPFYYFAYGAACTEVVVDTLTGENRILRTDILHDVGQSLNPALDIGQIEGGYVQGAGWLTMEELVWDDKGVLKTHAPSTYKIPATNDTPEIFNVHLWDGANTEDTIYRSKAVGEPPFMLGISAFLALSDTVASCGSSYPALNAPATPERLLMTMRGMQT